MGIFDTLKEAVDSVSKDLNDLKDLAGEETQGKIDDLFNDFGNKFEELAGNDNSKLGDVLSKIKEGAAAEDVSQEDLAAVFAKDPSEAKSSDVQSTDDAKSAKEKIVEVLSEEFPAYSIRYDVSPVSIGGQGRFMNYSLGVYDGDVPKLFIMLISKTTTAHREYRWSKEEAEKNGITFLNFVEHYPNRKEYISERLHKYL